MKNNDIIIIESVEVAERDGKEYRLVTDKAGTQYKFKSGRGGALEKKWPILEANVGKAIKLKVEQFKGFDFVADFTLVTDEFASQATEKAQTQAKEERTDSIEAQVCFKGMVELIIADKIKLESKEGKITMEWAMGRLNPVAEIISIIDKAKREIPQTTQAKLEPDQQEIKTMGQLLQWIMGKDPNIKTPRAWVATNFGVDTRDIFTTEEIQKLYEKIKANMGW